MSIRSTFRGMGLVGVITLGIGACSGIDQGGDGIGYEFIGLPYRVIKNTANVGAEYYDSGTRVGKNLVDYPRTSLAIGGLSTLGMGLYIYATRPRRREEPQQRRQPQLS